MKRAVYLLVVMMCTAGLLSCEGPVPVDEIVATSLTADKTTVKFPTAGGSEVIQLTTDAQEWAANTNGAEWLTVSPASGAGSAQLTLEAAKNTGNRRSASVTVSSPGLRNLTITVIQEAYEAPVVKTGLYSDPETLNADAPCTLYFKAEKGSSLVSADELYAHIGINEWSHVQADWGNNIEKCRFKETEVSGLWSLEIAPSIREWFAAGDEEIFRIAVVVRNADGTAQTADLFLAVQDSQNAFVPDPVVKESLPAGARHGINYNADGSVTFVLYDKDENGDSYDWCYVIGEFNDWERASGYAMKRDDDAACWWITLDGFDADKEYMFQYMIGDDDTRLRLSDPYSEIVYTSDDQWIASNTYPGLRSYPSQTSGYVSAFQINRDAYAWQVPDFKVEDDDDLIIYELLVRDFVTNGSKEGNLELVMEKFDYLETLGVNAIELMPIQEFDGNDSWGYNPNHYFAMDKAYGTREMYKKFIDECHKRGIAVIIDVVYNHLTGNNAYDKMYPLSINPFFNEVAPHPYSVFEDIDHENEVIVEYIKRSLGYLLTEYNVDGFRFDLTKGLTNKKSNESTASNYDASRVAILKGYNDYIKSVDKDAIVILEHFCDPENADLSKEGMKVWRNLNHAYCQTAMGYSSESSFGGLLPSGDVEFGSFVGYMESHDEERASYKQAAYGVAEVKGDIEARMQRLELNAAFFLTVPGPKMIWQFGELGYDTSIEDGGRTGRKTPRWDYLDVPARKALYDTYCGLIGFRRDNPEFFDEDASFSWKVGTNDWENGRIITCTAGSKSFVVVGNFTTAEKTLTVDMPSSGTWKNYFDSSDTYGGSTVTVKLPAGEFILLTNF